MVVGVPTLIISSVCSWCLNSYVAPEVKEAKRVGDRSLGVPIDVNLEKWYIPWGISTTYDIIG